DRKRIVRISESDIEGRFIGNCAWRYRAFKPERPGFYDRLFHILDSYETDSMAKKTHVISTFREFPKGSLRRRNEESLSKPHFDVLIILKTCKLPFASLMRCPLPRVQITNTITVFLRLYLRKHDHRSSPANPARLTPNV